MSATIKVSGTLGQVRELKSDGGKGPCWAVSVPVMIPGLTLEFMLSPRDPRDAQHVVTLVGSPGRPPSEHEPKGVPPVLPKIGAGMTVEVSGEFRMQMGKPVMFITGIEALDELELAQRRLAELQAAKKAAKPAAA